MTGFQQWQLWIGFLGVFVNVVLALLLFWWPRRTRLRVVTDHYRRGDESPANPPHLKINVINHSGFDVVVREVGLCAKPNEPYKTKTTSRGFEEYEQVQRFYLIPVRVVDLEISGSHGVTIAAQDNREFWVEPPESPYLKDCQAVYAKTATDKVFYSVRFPRISFSWRRLVQCKANKKFLEYRDRNQEEAAKIKQTLESYAEELRGDSASE